MGHKKRGMFIIINNRVFDRRTQMGERTGPFLWRAKAFAQTVYAFKLRESHWVLLPSFSVAVGQNYLGEKHACQKEKAGNWNCCVEMHVKVYAFKWHVRPCRRSARTPFSWKVTAQRVFFSGTDVDAANLYSLFKRLKFDVHMFNNQKTSEMIRILSQGMWKDSVPFLNKRELFFNKRELSYLEDKQSRMSSILTSGARCASAVLELEPVWHSMLFGHPRKSQRFSQKKDLKPKPPPGETKNTFLWRWHWMGCWAHKETCVLTGTLRFLQLLGRTTRRVIVSAARSWVTERKAWCTALTGSCRSTRSLLPSRATAALNLPADPSSSLSRFENCTSSFSKATKDANADVLRLLWTLKTAKQRQTKRYFWNWPRRLENSVRALAMALYRFLAKSLFTYANVDIVTAPTCLCFRSPHFVSRVCSVKKSVRVLSCFLCPLRNQCANQRWSSNLGTNATLFSELFSAKFHFFQA